MLNIDSIQNGLVIDHIKAGTGMQIYHLAGLDKLDCCVALIRNARSNKHGHKDIIKIESMIDLDLDVLGYVDPDITIDVIRDGVIVEKKKLEKPPKLVNVIRARLGCLGGGEVDGCYTIEFQVSYLLIQMRAALCGQGRW